MTFAVGDDLVQEFAFNPHLGQFTRSIQEVFVSKKSQKRRSEMLPVLHPDAAGVDICAEELFVAVPTDRDSQPVRRFSTFTRDLLELAEWLKRCGIRAVAMESTSAKGLRIVQAKVLDNPWLATNRQLGQQSRKPVTPVLQLPVCR